MGYSIIRYPFFIIMPEGKAYNIKKKKKKKMGSRDSLKIKKY